MKSTARQVSEYITKCAERSITSLEDIHKSLSTDISAIEDKLQEVEPLRIECRDLQKMQNHISSMLQTDKISNTFDDDSYDLKTLRKRIINIIEKQGALSNRDIIMKAGYNKDADTVWCLKYLATNEVIVKDPCTKKNGPGPKWESRNEC